MKYRDNGSIGALLDEYEKAILELKEVILTVTAKDLIHIVDAETKDDDCKSIQTILSHVVSAGFNYAIVIRRWLGEELEYRNRESLDSIDTYVDALDQMFAFNEKLFEDYPQIEIEEYDPNKKIHVSWGQKYDVEQLFEHAILHIMRHRRQIQKFIEILKENSADKSA